MLRPAWTSRIADWRRRPSVWFGLVLLLGTSLWAAAGRRERVVEHDVGTARASRLSEDGDRLDVAPPRIVDVARRLPQRRLDESLVEHSGPIQADYETRGGERGGNVHAAGFSAEVRANSPAWLTGTIEFEE